MSDLTFATPSQVSPTPSPNQPKNSRASVILVTIVVLALLAQMSYFFYNRYISNNGVGLFSNLSNSGTMNYEREEGAETAKDTPIDNPSMVSKTGPIYLDKGYGALEAIEKYPEEYLIKSEVKFTIQGKVISVEIGEFGIESNTFGARINLINTKGMSMGAMLSPTEVSKTKVVHVHQGVIQRELSLEELKPGDMVDVTVSVDLFDMRTNADNVLIEVRTY